MAAQAVEGAQGVGADWVEIEWEQGVYDLYMEYKGLGVHPTVERRR